MVWGMKRVAVAPFELKLGPNKSYRRAASVKPLPGAPKAQIRAKIRVILWLGSRWDNVFYSNQKQTNPNSAFPLTEPQREAHLVD